MVIDMNYLNKVIKNIFILVLSIVAVYLAFKLAIFYMPFLIAFILSLILEPLIRLLMRKVKLTRKASSIIIFVIAIAIIVGLLFWIITTLVTETSNLLSNINVYIDTGYNIFQNLVSKIDLSKFNIPQNVMDIIEKEVGLVFVKVLECAGVFKRDKKGQDAFDKFISVL